MHHKNLQIDTCQFLSFGCQMASHSVFGTSPFKPLAFMAWFHLSTDVWFVDEKLKDDILPGSLAARP